MAETERRARAEIRLDFPVKRRMDFIRREHHDDIGRCHGTFDQGSTEARSFNLDCAPRAAAKPDDHVDPAIVKVERLGAALVAVAEDGDALARQRSRIDVGVAQQIHGLRTAQTGRSPA